MASWRVSVETGYSISLPPVASNPHTVHTPVSGLAQICGCGDDANPHSRDSTAMLLPRSPSVSTLRCCQLPPGGSLSSSLAAVRIKQQKQGHAAAFVGSLREAGVRLTAAVARRRLRENARAAVITSDTRSNGVSPLQHPIHIQPIALCGITHKHIGVSVIPNLICHSTENRTLLGNAPRSHHWTRATSSPDTRNHCGYSAGQYPMHHETPHPGKDVQR